MGLLDGNNVSCSNGKATHIEYDKDIHMLHVIAGKDVRVPVDQGLWELISGGKKQSGYPLDILERCNFLRVKDWDYGRRVLSISSLRTILFSYRRINLYDRNKLVLLGLEEDDMDIRLSEVIKSKRVATPLIKYNILHLWQLLLLTEDALSYVDRVGVDGLEYIKNTLKTYGYSLLSNNYADDTNLYEDTAQFYLRFDEKLNKDGILRKRGNKQ